MRRRYAVWAMNAPSLRGMDCKRRLSAAWTANDGGRLRHSRPRYVARRRNSNHGRVRVSVLHKPLDRSRKMQPMASPNAGFSAARRLVMSAMVILPG